MDSLIIPLKYYGISPWEIEVIYGLFKDRFQVKQEEVEQIESEFVSMLDVPIPLAFNEEFFKWFDYRRWEKVKAIFKEMKRRRGSGNALKINVIFSGSPKIRFVLDAEDSQWFNNSVEKIDFLLELLPYHLDPEKLPNDVTEIIYHYAPESARWRLNSALVKEKKFIFTNNEWKIVT
ncbi:MAG TPA: hypothetical protein VD731_03560 [Nitrosopumilaceae archaeon]|nr:hypothetical protein [Nitrosopumilaceae archaeon]